MKHLKKLLGILGLCFLFLSVPVHTEAAEKINLPDGFFIGDNQGVTVTKNGGYFFNLEGLLPGDTITRNLMIQNTRSDSFRLKMVIEPISTIGPVNLLEKMTMLFTLDGKVIFDGNLVNENAAETKQGTEINFGTIPAGSEQTMKIELKVKTNIPWEDFNAGESRAKVKWTFIAERDETTPSSSSETPTSSSSEPVTVKPVGKYPSTGETVSKILFTLGGLLLIMTVMLYFFYYRKKEADQVGDNK